MATSTTDDATEKWNRHYRDSTALPCGAPVLRDNTHLLPASGAALDLACGLGGNALLLAETGLHCDAWDRSEVAIERLRNLAVERDLPIRPRVRDVVAEPPAPSRFDVIVVSFFLDRTLMPALAAALRPGGLLFYQTFTALKRDPAGPSNPNFLLEEGELLRWFGTLRLRMYREEGRLGDLRHGERNTAQLIVEKPTGEATT